MDLNTPVKHLVQNLNKNKRLPEKNQTTNRNQHN